LGCLIGTPDIGNALQAIEALKSGCPHVYVQKPISVDVVEGELWSQPQRKLNKGRSGGTQRKKTPHLYCMPKKNIVTQAY